MCVPRQFTPAFRFLWVVLSRFLDGWEDLVHLMKTETVTRWHTRAFRLFWRWRSRLGRRAVMAGLGGRGRRGNNHPLDRGSPPSADADSLARRC